MASSPSHPGGRKIKKQDGQRVYLLRSTKMPQRHGLTETSYLDPRGFGLLRYWHNCYFQRSQYSAHHEGLAEEHETSCSQRGNGAGHQAMQKKVRWSLRYIKDPLLDKVPAKRSLRPNLEVQFRFLHLLGEFRKQNLRLCCI